MILTTLATLLVLGIAFYQVIQGLYSALVMTVLTVVCALLAFALYEPLASQFLYSRQPATADAIMLVALFVLPLLALRIVIDRFMGGNVVFGPWADRIGGGLLGLITGEVAVGVLMIALQMLPVGASVFGYRPFDKTLQRTDRIGPLYPDEFVLGMVDIASSGALGGDDAFSRRHPDLTRELFCARNRAGMKMRSGAPTNALSVQGAYDATKMLSQCVKDPERSWLAKDGARKNIYVIRVAVSEDAREEEGDWWLLPGTQFRLVTADGKGHYPVGYLWYDEKQEVWKAWEPGLEEGRPMVTELVVGRPWKDGPKELVVDWIYALDADKAAGLELKPDPNQPSPYVVFRRVARAEVPTTIAGLPDAKTALHIRPPTAWEKQQEKQARDAKLREQARKRKRDEEDRLKRLATQPATQPAAPGGAAPATP